MNVSDHNADVPKPTKPDAAQADPVAIIQRKLGPLAIDLWGTQKLRQLARELRRAEEEWEEVRGDAEFDAFFAAYPRKEDRLRAARIFRTVRRHAGAQWPALRQKIMATAPRADENASDERFIPYPSTWLKDQRWDDEDFNQPRGDQEF